jgi:hypothetical protein
MTLRPQPLPPIPEATAAAVQAAFPIGMSRPKLLRTSGFCPHAYGAAVWKPRHNILGHRCCW